VPHYRKRSDVPVPADHTPVTLTSGEKTVPLILKMKESDVLAAVNRNWEIGVQKDLRLPTLVSVLKSTHLALFRLLGYQYGRSAAGHFLGYDVLGTFYLRHGRDSREGVLAAAWQHFHQFDNMARPIQEASGDFRGSVTDRKMYLCKTDAWPWALMVFLRMGPVKFTVLVPVFEHEHAIARYLRFLANPEPEFEAHLAIYRGHSWEVSKTAQRFNWPVSTLVDS